MTGPREGAKGEGAAWSGVVVEKKVEMNAEMNAERHPESHVERNAVRNVGDRVEGA
jgi:hypothetical protein